VNRLYEQPADAPRSFRLLRAAWDYAEGKRTLETAAGDAGVRPATVSAIANAADLVMAACGVSLDGAHEPERMTRARVILGQLVQGQLAERAFESIYRTTMGTDDLHLEDARESNIKFHGTLFRKARDLVGLDPEDCFALATYKIYQGLQKQEKEVLPYLFVVVSAPGVTGAEVGQAIPVEFVSLVSLVHASSKVHGKRALEERIVAHLVAGKSDSRFGPALDGYRRQIEAAEWRVLSARRANDLLRKLLFERVFAVRVRAFARNYRNAELDMHFSIRQDLTPLGDFLGLLKNSGLHGLTARLERGVI
jgi:hypothetical protein